MLTLLLGPLIALPAQPLGSIPAPTNGYHSVVGPASDGSFGVFIQDSGRDAKFHRWDARMKKFHTSDGVGRPILTPANSEYVALVYPDPGRQDFRGWRTEIIEIRSGEIVGKFDRQPLAQAGSVFTFGRLYRAGGHDRGFCFDAKSRAELKIGSDEIPTQVFWDTSKRRLAFAFGQESGNYIEEYAPGTDRLLQRVKISEWAIGFGSLHGDPDFGPFAITQEFIGVGIESIQTFYISRNLERLGSIASNYVEKSRTGKIPPRWWLTMKSKENLGVGYEDIMRGNDVTDRMFVAVDNKERVLWRKRGLKSCFPYMIGSNVAAVSPDAIAMLDGRTGERLKRIPHPDKAKFQFIYGKNAIFAKKAEGRIEFISQAL